MKKFNKVLAVLLSLVMLFSVIPVSAFAAETPTSGNSTASGSSPSGAPGNTGNFGADVNLPVSILIPDPTGTGASGTVTLTLNAGQLVAALKDVRSIEALVELMRDMVSTSTSDIVTMDEILELIPVENLMVLLLGENNENASALIEQFGGFDELMKMIDLNGLIATANVEGLAQFVLDLEDVASLVYIENVLEVLDDIGVELNWGAAYGYVDLDKVIARLKELNSKDDFDQLLSFFDGNMANLQAVIDMKALSEYLVEHDIITDKVDIDAIVNNEELLNLIASKVGANYRNLLTDEGIAALREVLKDAVDVDKLKAELKAELEEELKDLNPDELDLPEFDENDLKPEVLEQLKAELKDTLKAELEEQIRPQIEAKWKEKLIGTEENPGELFEMSQEQLVDLGFITVTGIDSYITNEDVILEYYKADIEADARAEAEKLIGEDELKELVKPYLTEWVKADAEALLVGGTVQYLSETGAAKVQAVIDELIDDEIQKQIDAKIDGVIDEALKNVDPADIAKVMKDENNYDVPGVRKEILAVFQENQGKFNPLDYLVAGYDPFTDDAIKAVVFEYVDWDAFGDPNNNTIDRAALVKWMIGENGSIADLMKSEGALKEYVENYVDLNPVFNEIKANRLALDRIVNMDALLDTIQALPSEKIGTLFGLLNRATLIEQLMPNIRTLAGKLTRDQIKTILTTVMTSVLSSVNFISLNGYELVTADGDGFPALNYGAFAKAVLSMIPTLQDLATTTGELVAFNLYIDYNVRTDDGYEHRVKDLNFEVVLEGHVDQLNRLAAKLAQYITISRNGNQLYVELTVPSVVAAAYAKLLNSDRGTAIKQELLALLGKDVSDWVEAFDQLTLEQIINVLAKVNPEEVYSALANLSYVELLLEKASEMIGGRYDLDSLKDLNNVMHILASDKVTLEHICAVVENLVHADVMAMLEKVTATADKVATVQKCLDKLAGVPYFGKLIEGMTATQILEEYKDVNPIMAVANFISQKTGTNFAQMLANGTADEIWQAALNRASDYEGYFKRIQGAIVNAMNPDYVPTSEWAKTIYDLIPQGLLKKILASSITDLYRGNGSFSAAVESISLDLGAISKRLVNLLYRGIPAAKDYEDIINKFLPEATVTFGVSAKLNINNLFQVTYLDEFGREPLVTTFLPYGVNPAGMITPPAKDGKDFLYWADENGNEVTKVTGDMTLTAVYSNTVIYTVEFVVLNAKGEEIKLGNIQVPFDYIEEGITAEAFQAIADQLNFAAYGFEYPAEAYTLTWKDENGNTVVPTELEITGDAKLTASYSINQYTVTVSEKDGEGNTYTLAYGTALKDIIEAIAAPEGYNTLWYAVNANGELELLSGAPANATVTGELNYVYEFSKNLYTVTIKDHKGTEHVFTVPYGEKLTAEQLAEAMPGVADCGLELPAEAYNTVWENGASADAILNTAVKENLTYAWSYQIKTFTVTVTGNGQTVELTVEWGTELKLENLPLREGESFSEQYNRYTWVGEDGYYAAEWLIGTAKYQTAQLIGMQIKADTEIALNDYTVFLYKTYFVTFVDEKGNAITDADGNPYKIAVKHENAKNSTVKVNAATGEPDANGVTEKSMIRVSFAKASEIIKQIGNAASYGHVNGQYTLYWYQGEEKTGSGANGISGLASFTADAVFQCKYEVIDGTVIFKDSEDKELNADAITYDAENNTFTVEQTAAENGTFALQINVESLLSHFGNTEKVILKESNGKITAEISKAVLNQLNSAGEKVVFSYTTGKGNVQMTGDIYSYNNPEHTVFQFTLTVDEETFDKDFAGEFKITVPYDQKISSDQSAVAHTAVYVQKGNTWESVTLDDNANPGSVTFCAPHFSDYIIVNEYKITASYAYSDQTAANGTLNVNGQFIPEGATINYIVITMPEGLSANYYIDSIRYTDAEGKLLSVANGTALENMPGQPLELKVTYAKINRITRYLVGTTVYNTKAEAEAATLTLPTGYKLKDNKVEWVETEFNGDKYLTLATELITYKVMFGEVEVQFTVLDFAQSYYVPAVPEQTGKTGAWTNLPEGMDNIITAMNGATTLTVTAAYTNRTYKITLPNGTTVNCEFGTDYTLGNLGTKVGYTLGKVTYVALNDITNEVEVTGGKFTMPASDVTVYAQWIPNTLHFNVVNSTTGEGKPLEATFGSYASYTVNVPKGYILESAPLGTLVSYAVNADGSKTLTYSLLITEELTDNTEISYRLIQKSTTTVNIANGTVTNDGTPASSIKDLTFDHFATPDNAKFDSDQYGFAVYARPESAASLLWMWILIAVVVLIILIAFFYTLYIKGHLKPNFILKFFTWLVSIYFAFCLAISGVILWLLQGTKTREQIDYEAYGVEKPADLKGKKPGSKK